MITIGGVAQLVRATACHAVGRAFESRRPRRFRHNRPKICSAQSNTLLRDQKDTLSPLRLGVF